MRLLISTKLGIAVVASALSACLPLPTRAQAVAPVSLSADGSTARIDGEITPLGLSDHCPLTAVLTD